MIKKLIPPILIGSIFFVVGCQAPAGSDGKNLAIVQQYVDAVKNNDLDAMGALLSDNYLGLGPSVGDSTNKQLALESWQYNSENVYESISYDMMQLLEVSVPDGPAKGEWVANWSLVTIMYKDGRGPVSLWVNVVYKVEDGKIARSRTFYNEADVYSQLGYRLFPPLQLPDDES